MLTVEMQMKNNACTALMMMRMAIVAGMTTNGKLQY